MHETMKEHRAGEPWKVGNSLCCIGFHERQLHKHKVCVEIRTLSCSDLRLAGLLEARLTLSVMLSSHLLKFSPITGCFIFKSIPLGRKDWHPAPHLYNRGTCLGKVRVLPKAGSFVEALGRCHTAVSWRERPHESGLGVCQASTRHFLTRPAHQHLACLPVVRG